MVLLQLYFSKVPEGGGPTFSRGGGPTFSRGEGRPNANFYRNTYNL